MRKRLAVMGVSAALVLGFATVAMASGGYGPGTNPDCTGQQVRMHQEDRVAGDSEAIQLQSQIRSQFRDGTDDQAMHQVRTQAQVREPAGDQAMTRNRTEAQRQEPAGDMDQQRTRAMDQDGDCDGTGPDRTQARQNTADGSASANGRQGGNGNGK